MSCSLIKRNIIVLFLISSLFSSIQTTARARGLGGSFFAFSDNFAGLSYNPALTILAPSSEFAVSAGMLQFGQFKSDFNALLKKEKFNILANASFLNVGYMPIYKDGARIEDRPSVYDSSLALGTSFLLKDFLLLGATIDANVSVLIDNTFFDQNITLGAAYIIDRWKKIHITTGLSLKKSLFQNRTEYLINKDLKSVLSAKISVLKIKTDFGLAFLYDIDKNRYGFSLGIEAFKDFFISPRLSVNSFSYDLDNKRYDSIEASGGLSAGFNLGNFHYKIEYAINQSIINNQDSSSPQHFVTLFMHRNLNETTHVRRSRLLVGLHLTKFNELYSVASTNTDNTNNTKKIEQLDNIVGLNIGDITSTDKNRYIVNMLDFANQNLNSFLCAHPNLKKNIKGELILSSQLKTDGELMKLTFTLKNRSGKTVYLKQYAGPFTVPYKNLEKVERVRYIKIAGKLKIVPSSSPPFVKKNNDTIASFIKQFQLDLYDFIENSYLKKLTLTCSQYNSQIYVDNKYVGNYNGTPISLLLKSRKYIIKAERKGLTEVTKKILLNKSQKIDIRFQEQFFMINIKTHLLTSGVKPTITIGGKTKKISSQYIFKDISSTNKVISFKNYYSIKEVPLNITKAMDHNIFLLPNFKSSFNNTNIWQVEKQNHKYDIETKESSVVFKGNGISGDDFLGIKTVPFIVQDFNVSFNIKINADGRFNFILIDQAGNKTAVVIRNGLIAAQSDLDQGKNPEDSDQKSLLTAFKVNRGVAFINIEKKADKIIIESDGKLLYEGEFQSSGFLRLLIGCENRFENKKINNEVKNLKFKNL